MGDREGTARLAAVVLQAADPIITTSLEGIIETWNEAADRLFGYPAAEVIGRDETFLVPRGAEHELHDIRMRVSRGEAYNTFSARRIDAAGRHIEVAISAFPLRDDDGLVVGLARIVRDTSALHSAEAALKERRAQDLRDRYVGTLFQVGLGLDSIRAEAGSNPELAAHTDHVFHLIEAMLQDLRRDAELLDLSESRSAPDLARDLPLLVKDLLPLTITSVVNLSAEGLHALRPPVAETLYYVAQESLVNIIRHSSASRVGIDVRQQSGEIAITIQDDGGGFDPASMRRGLGMARMRSRVVALDGAFAFYAIPGMGTTVRASLPL